MMLASFQSSYPTACVISELLTIYQGKFVVRVSVQNDGITRATALAAAEVLEEAEDKARSRAIALITTQTQALQSETTTIPQPPTTKPVVPEPVVTSAPTEYKGVGNQAIASEPPTELEPATLTDTKTKHLTDNVVNLGVKGKTKRSLTSNYSADEQEVFGDFGMTEPTYSSTTRAVGSKSSITPISEPEPDFDSEIQTNIIEPIDLSGDLITIKVKLEESGWKPDTEREYLERTYGKSSRHELTPEQVQEFRRYLELFSQTTEITKELRKLNWNNDLGRRYLGQTYNRKLRQELNYQQLQEFLSYLKSERDRLTTK